jgi:GT2 family glycosyltransferase
MDLSIIILNYNTNDFLLPCIKGIIEHTVDLDYEIIIVDNNSTDGTVSYIEQRIIPKYDSVKLIKNKSNKGFAHGNNLGMKHANGDYYLIMNSDILIWDNALKKLVEFMNNNPKAGIAGPRLLSPDGSLQYFAYEFPSPLVLLYRRTPLARFDFAKKAISKYLMTNWDHLQNKTVDWVQGSCMIVRKSATQKIGLMDEQFFMFLEDTDWCRRIWKAGYQVWYVAEIEIIHYHGRASSVGKFYMALFNKMSWVHLNSAIKYFRKWGFAIPH